MMETESSVIARKLENYFVIENSEEAIPKSKKEGPGILKNILLVSLMGAAVLCTQLTLLLVKWVKRLEA